MPRNVRLALAGIDLVAPYVEARRTLPAEPVVAGACMPLEWIAWGAISVEASSPVCRQPPASEWTACGDERSGEGVWGPTSTPLKPHTFRGCAYLPASAVGVVEVAVRAKVDTAWSRVPGGAYTPAVAPQSHLARARADGYSSSNNGHSVTGHTFWLSAPFRVQVGAAATPPPPPSPPPPLPPPPHPTNTAAAVAAATTPAATCAAATAPTWIHGATLATTITPAAPTGAITAAAHTSAASSAATTRRRPPRHRRLRIHRRHHLPNSQQY